MMDLSKLIRERRSIKPESFNGDIIDSSEINQLLENAIWAPTHGRTEPWQFYVFSKDALKTLGNDLATAYKETTSADSFDIKKFEQLQLRPSLASHIIGVSMVKGENPKIPVQEEMLACACAVQNILLTATSHGIASFWSTGPLINTPFFKEKFNLRAEDYFLGLIYLGKCNELNATIGKRNSTYQSKTNYYH